MVHSVLPDASLIATVLDEEQSLPDFLSSLEAQSLHPAEILIVDGGSTDLTVALLSAWSPACGCRVRVLEASGASISAGRNLAIESARHERIVVTDAGTTQRRDWFERLTDGWHDDPEAVLSGFFEPIGDTFVSRAIASVITPTRAEIDPRTFLPSSRSVAFPREAWREVGGYPEWLDYCEDLVFDLAIKETRRTFAFAPDAIVSWAGRPTLGAFAKQYYRYARGDGKAGLYVRRHLLRYGAYSVAALTWWFSPWALCVVLIGFAGYVARPVRRVWARRELFPSTQLTGALLFTPVIVVTGDIAKMAGYPPGVLWRRRAHR